MIIREETSQSLILSVGEWEGLQSFLLVPSVLFLSSAFAFFSTTSLLLSFHICGKTDRVVQYYSPYISYGHTAAPSTRSRQYKGSWEGEESAVYSSIVPGPEGI